MKPKNQSMHDALVAIHPTARFIARVCESKASFKTQQEAAGTGVGKDGWKLNPYHCPICGQWHRTKQKNQREL